MTDDSITTPAAAGFVMPAEFEPHAGCLMAWPCRADLWGDRLDDAKRDYATVAKAIAAFEPVIMVCNEGGTDDVRDWVGQDVIPVEIPIDDSWSRDSGPAFVRNAAGEIAVVGFGFNAWGNRWHPHDDDARLSERLAQRLGLAFFKAPFVLEGGSFFVDGEGTLITTEQCLLNPNRNPHLTREQIEQGLKDHLGVTTVIWLPFGHSLDTGPAGTDGHVDGVLQYIAPGRVMIEVVADPNSPDHQRGLANLERLRAAHGRQRSTVRHHHPRPRSNSDRLVRQPLPGERSCHRASRRHRCRRAGARSVARRSSRSRVVGVPGETLAYGGGGPHCITQQIPAGVELPAGT